MMLKKIVIIGVLMLTIGGCTTLTPVDFGLEDVQIAENRQDAEMVNLDVSYVPVTRGVKIETNHLVPPAWETALSDAIYRSLLFEDDSENKVSVSVRISHFDIPAAGFEMVSDCAAIYEIMDRATGEVVFTQEISSEGRTPIDFAFAGVIRMQESINRCVRENISSFIEVVGS